MLFCHPFVKPVNRIFDLVNHVCFSCLGQHIFVLLFNMYANTRYDNVYNPKLDMVGDFSISESVRDAGQSFYLYMYMAHKLASGGVSSLSKQSYMLC